MKHFSISHSDEYIALLFSDSKCGVDIEKIIKTYKERKEVERLSKEIELMELCGLGGAAISGGKLILGSGL